MKDYECYHAVCQYSSDGCNGCKHEMDCYNHFLNYMLRGKIKQNEDIKKDSLRRRK